MTKKNMVFLIRVIVFVILTIPIAILIIGPVVVGILGGSDLVFSYLFIGYFLYVLPFLLLLVGVLLLILISRKLKSDIAELEQELEELEESGELEEE